MTRRRVYFAITLFAVMVVFLQVLLLVAVMVGPALLDRALLAEPSAERCLRFTLPAGARVVAETGSISPFGGERFFVIEMTRDEFEQFTAAGGFTSQAAQVENWPRALDAPAGFPWSVNRVNDQFTIYRDANGALDVARWENGRLYYRHHVP